MLFNSYVFLGLFLPATLLAFYLSRRHSHALTLRVVALASLFFYGYWEPKYLALIVPMVLANCALGQLIARTRRKAWLRLGVAGDLGVLIWFKYSLFFYTSVTSSPPPTFIQGIVLPLGISFFTFQMIGYLVDVWDRRVEPASLDRFAFFVLFFPQLIAGPIVQYRQIVAQLRRRHTFAYLASATQVGLVIFAIGLFKKVVLADSLAPVANAVYAFAGRTNYDLAASDAWMGALAYSLQLYFDFSGYSDMCLGMGRMFGLRIPINFNSPYQATSIVDFWRRWHITLSSFLRSYLYIPLGGNRMGPGRQALNQFIVFALAGLWHGAGWTFVVWGCAHGMLVAANHVWTRTVGARLTANLAARGVLMAAYGVASRGLTLLAVICLWVFFRAPNFEVAAKIIEAMSLQGPVTGAAVYPDSNLYPVVGALLLLLWVLVILLPNSLQLVRHARRRHRDLGWVTVLGTGAILYFAIASIAKVQSAFIYFNF